MVVVDAFPMAPVEGPTQPPNHCDSGNEGEERIRTRGGLIHVDDLRVVFRHVDHLGVGGLDADDLGFLDVDLVLIPGEKSFRIGPGADQLDRVVDIAFLEVKRLTEGNRPIDVSRHHGDHLLELQQRDHRRVPVLGGFGGEFLEIRLALKELVGLDHVERAG
jgi:hypothetical protein